MKKGETIVKVQLPILTIGAGEFVEVLVYNRDETLSFVIEAEGKEFRRIKKAMKGEDKAFFYACKHCEQVDFNRPAPWQDW